MNTLHIANTFFEWELETDPQIDLYRAFHTHLIYLQLQFLPLLYASPEDQILVSDLPPLDYLQHLTSPPNLVSLSAPSLKPDTTIESWGPSRLIATWAKQHNLSYEIPDWDVVRHVNSKVFSFLNSPRLPHAALLHDASSVHKWLNAVPGKKVLKSCFGLSGAGHLILAEGETSPRLNSFLAKEFEKGRPILAEPWVERLLDFSTQWEISPSQEITYIGATLCHNDEKGKYQWSEVGEETELFARHLDALETHKQSAQSVLEKMAQLHFFGNVGIDAMLHKSGLHPIVEINARKTMGWAALQFQRRHFPDQLVAFRYTSSGTGLLPSHLVLKNGKQICFRRNLTNHPL